MFWKSTAIFVQATSRPSTGLGVRPFQASADKMSEAVNSDVLSVGKLDIRCDLSPGYDANSDRGRWPLATTHDTVHGLCFPRIAADSRTAVKEHKLTACSNSYSPHAWLQSIGHIALNVPQVLEVGRAAPELCCIVSHTPRRAGPVPGASGRHSRHRLTVAGCCRSTAGPR